MQSTTNKARRKVTLAVRPLEAFKEQIQKMPYLFHVAPAMTKHWALIIGNVEQGANMFEIGIGEKDRIFANEPQPWDEVRKSGHDWKLDPVGYTYLSDGEILQQGEDAISVMGPHYGLYSENCQMYARMLFQAIRTSGPKDLLKGLPSLPKPMEVFLRRCKELGVGSITIIPCTIVAVLLLFKLPEAVLHLFDPESTSLWVSVSILVVSMILFTGVYTIFSDASLIFFRGLLKGKEDLNLSRLFVMLASAFMSILALRANWVIFYRIVDSETDLVSYNRPVLVRVGLVGIAASFEFVLIWTMAHVFSGPTDQPMYDKRVIYVWVATFLASTGLVCWELGLEPQNILEPPTVHKGSSQLYRGTQDPYTPAERWEIFLQVGLSALIGAGSCLVGLYFMSTTVRSFMRRNWSELVS